MIKYQLQLDYALAPGWLKPWAAGLLGGEAVARKCGDCGRVSFIPLRICDCGGADGSWITLSGGATILNITRGSDGCFGLVCLDGSDTSCVARLSGFDPDARRGPGARRGQIARPDGDLPAVIINPRKTERS